MNSWHLARGFQFAGVHSGIRPDPERLDLRRQAGEHVAFGGGIHFCLGAPLARLEGQIAIGELVSRFPSLEIDTDGAVLRDTVTLRGLTALPATV